MILLVSLAWSALNNLIGWRAAQDVAPAAEGIQGES
jgi:hypothetical protein